MDIEQEAQRLLPYGQVLCNWFETVRRPLPWRESPTPYRVWVSEIMLQQTRIEAVLPYFDRFMTALPSVEALAAVPTDRLMKLWEGLGYYSRARNLQKAAQVLFSDYGGALPADYDALRALPGIGEYTAGAIASIAFGIPVPAVDGNVLRVLARLTACKEDVMRPAVRRGMTALAAAILPRARAGIFNQALMELGERVCMPNTVPHCEDCPVANGCKGFRDGVAAALPVRAPKKPRRIEQRTVWVLLTDEPTPRVVLHRRAAKGLLAGLWELPNTEGWETPALPIAALRLGSDWLPLPDSKHIFTHIEWHMKGLLGVIAPPSLPCDFQLVSAGELAHYALPTAFRAYTHMLPIWLKQKGGD